MTRLFFNSLDEGQSGVGLRDPFPEVRSENLSGIRVVEICREDDGDGLVPLVLLVLVALVILKKVQELEKHPNLVTYAASDIIGLRLLLFT